MFSLLNQISSPSLPFQWRFHKAVLGITLLSVTNERKPGSRDLHLQTFIKWGGWKSNRKVDFRCRISELQLYPSGFLLVLPPWGADFILHGYSYSSYHRLTCKGRGTISSPLWRAKKPFREVCIACDWAEVDHVLVFHQSQQGHWPHRDCLRPHQIECLIQKMLQCPWIILKWNSDISRYIECFLKINIKP